MAVLKIKSVSIYRCVCRCFCR